VCVVGWRTCIRANSRCGCVGVWVCECLLWIVLLHQLQYKCRDQVWVTTKSICMCVCVGVCVGECVDVCLCVCV